MKSRIGKVLVGFGVGLVAFTAVAWDNMNYTVSKLGVETVENPSGTRVTINDQLGVVGNVVVTGNVTVTGTGTYGVIAGTITNFTGNGANVTNLNAANLASGNTALARVTNALVTATAVGNATTALDGEGSSITNISIANIVGGWSGVITNVIDADGALTNILYYFKGVVTNVLHAAP